MAYPNNIYNFVATRGLALAQIVSSSIAQILNSLFGYNSINFTLYVGIPIPNVLQADYYLSRSLIKSKYKHRRVNLKKYLKN